MTTVAAIVIAAVDRIEGGFAALAVVLFGLLRLGVLGMVMFRKCSFSFKGTSGLIGAAAKQRGTT
ncbi:MAG: hypothetical protein ABJF09_06745 [Qipengyuania citrea]|uniref:hypothetical protein n=1 Tax=Qipengyuania citrea TaxID=225971 RepID=UPI003264E2DE